MHKEKSVLRLSNKRELLFKVPQAGLPPLRMYYLKSDFTTDIAHTGQMAYQKSKSHCERGSPSHSLSTAPRNLKSKLGSYLGRFPIPFSITYILFKKIPIYQLKQY